VTDDRAPAPLPPPAALDDVVTLRDFEPLARARMRRPAFEYYAGGAWDETTLAGNEAAFERYRLRPRVLVDVSTVDTSTTLLGRRVALPVGVAPAALHGLAHPSGELATARAASTAGAVFCLSTVSSRSIEAVAEAAPDGPRWFQLYVRRDRGFGRGLVERAVAAGYEALVVTVDLPVLGYRDRDRRMRFDPGPGAYGNLPSREAFEGNFDDLLDMRSVGLTWDHLAEIGSWSSLPLVLKGVMTAEDARLAVEHGAAAVWVSNHGGRQLDRVPAALDVLADVAEAVAGRAEVYVDGGFRRGPDVLIGLALGARAVFTARPFLYALATAGEAGVAHAFGIVREELERAMAILGTPTIADIAASHLDR
jgi:isopentenyl diphosphate isomerase/L-lactate dehydrogenase-like FMN-dependent dehydrogenase